jgi:murein DD-endopeptidase MepM/ murein hydrolase activator NlpD
MIKLFFTIIFYGFISLSHAQEGYPSVVVEIVTGPQKNAVIKNSSCFPVTVSVNARDYLVEAKSEVQLDSSFWGAWFWIPGKIGRMSELTFPSPLREKSQADFGPGTVETHTKEYEFSYDFSVPEGTSVYAIEEGTVIRVIQKYTQSHQDKTRIHEVNKVEILHLDGSVAAYAHLKAQSVPLKICDKISKGQIIGLSGNTGFSSGPHLHLDVTRPIGIGKFKTIPIRFTARND